MGQERNIKNVVESLSRYNNNLLELLCKNRKNLKSNSKFQLFKVAEFIRAQHLVVSVIIPLWLSLCVDGGTMKDKQKHLTLSDIITIEQGLNEDRTFTKIATSNIKECRRGICGI